MTIRELIELFVEEQQFTIYDCDAEKNVFTGYIDELPDEYEYKEVSSIDNIDNLNGTEILTINV